MNYLFAFAACMALTVLTATDQNYRQLLISDINVALFLALAWLLEAKQ